MDAVLRHRRSESLITNPRAAALAFKGGIFLVPGGGLFAADAAEQRLIDAVGGMSDVKKYLQEKIGDEPTICWYRRTLQ